MRKISLLILLPFIFHIFFIGEAYSFVENTKSTICSCNHSSKSEIHISQITGVGDCHSHKDQEPHRCVCKISKSKKNHVSLSHSPLILPTQFHILQPAFKFLYIHSFYFSNHSTGFKISLLKPPK